MLPGIVFDRDSVVCWRWRWQRGLKHGVRPGQRMCGGIFILVLALRRRRCNRRRGKQSHHSKRSEDMRPKTIRHKRLQNCSAVLQLTANSITIAGKLQAMEPAGRLTCAAGRFATSRLRPASRILPPDCGVRLHLGQFRGRLPVHPRHRPLKGHLDSGDGAIIRIIDVQRG